MTLCQKHQWLWRALEQLFPVSFVAFEPDEALRLDALVAVASDQNPAFLTTAPKVPCFVSRNPTGGCSSDFPVGGTVAGPFSPTKRGKLYSRRALTTRAIREIVPDE